MKNKLFLVGTVALLLGSCSEGLENPVANRDGKTIDFAVSHSGTRVVESDNMITVGGFKLWAVQGATPVEGLNGVTVSYSSGTWNYGPPVSWPEGSVNFYAYAPSASIYIAAGTGTEVTYTVPAPAAQEDFLIATKTASVDDGVVQLQFDHALARVEVKAKFSDGGIKVISGIKLLNLQNKGTIDLANGPYTYADDGSAYNTWPVASDALTNYEVSTSVSVTGTDYVDVLTGANGLVVLPQETELGEFNATGDDIVAGKENAFYLVATIDGVDKYYKIADKYDPTKGIVFEAGRKYTLRLNLNASPVPSANIEVNAGLNGYTTPTAPTDLTNDDSAVIASTPGGGGGGGGDVEDADAVTIGGTTWASKNVGEPGAFAADFIPDNAQYYQWGIDVAWTYDDVNAPVGWSSTVSGTATDTWNNGDGPCPTGWRLPNQTELASLTSNTFTWTQNYNSSNSRGIIFTDDNGKELLLQSYGRLNAASGKGENRPSSGYYWSSESEATATAQYISFTRAGSVGSYSATFAPGSNDRARACSVRCVKKTS